MYIYIYKLIQPFESIKQLVLVFGVRTIVQHLATQLDSKFHFFCHLSHQTDAVAHSCLTDNPILNNFHLLFRKRP